MDKVTIGIPLYNAEKHITQTLESALNQTYPFIEFLIIDDKGNDHSIDIIHKFQKDSPRGKDIKIITHKKNLGVAAARNTIIQECTGKYLFFLDSDDRITSDCIEKLYNVSIKENADVIYGSYYEEWENSEKESIKYILPSKTFIHIDELAAFANQNLYQTLRSFVWNILYDISFIRQTNIKFQSVRVWEDLLFYYDIIPLVKRAVLLPDITYIYRKRQGSLSQYNFRDTIPLQEITEHAEIREYCKQKCLELTHKTYFPILVTKTMRICLDTAAVAIEKRKIFVPKLTALLIKKILKHPLSFQQIMQLKQYTLFNLSIYIIEKLHYKIIIRLLCFYNEILKSHRKK